jgi:hypothetical protein
MKGTKDCWNPACVCWCNEPDTSNCASEDIEPQDCRLADIDLRTAINIFNLHMKQDIPCPVCDDPDRISFYYMHDNHTFTRLKGRALYQIADHCYAVRKKSYYGMLCPPILLQGDREIRRVGVPVHCSGPDKDGLWFENVNAWMKFLEKDPDVMRLILTNEPYPKELDV